MRVRFLTRAFVDGRLFDAGDEHEMDECPKVAVPVDPIDPADGGKSAKPAKGKGKAKDSDAPANVEDIL